jgi:hypothetical protein
MKLIKWALLAVVLLVVVAVGIFFYALDGVVRRTVESQATKSLDTPTTLGGASVSPFRGKVSLDDLKIANPPGYAADHIFTLGDVKVAVTYGQLRNDPVRIDTLSLKEPVVTLEQKDLKTNIQALMDRLPKGEEQPTADNKQPLHLIIGDLTVENPTVVLRPGLPGLSQEIKLSLPTINMKDVGTGPNNQNGAAIKDVVMLVLTEIASKAADSDQIPPELRQLLNLNVNQLATQLKTQLNVQLDKVSQDLSQKLGGELGSTVGDVLKNPQSATTNPSQLLEKGLGGLLNEKPKAKAKPATRPARK